MMSCAPFCLFMLAAILFSSLHCPQARAEDAPPGMVYIQGGQCTLGITESTANTLSQLSGNHPTTFPTQQRTVPVAAFFIDKYEVTNAAYETFVRDSGHRYPHIWQGSKCPDNLRDLPVVGVDIDDARAYALWAGKRLPTEEEWEWAARGAAGRLYPWGDAWEPGAANVFAAELYGPAPGGAFPKDVTPEGVCDMGGNVSEWVSSNYAQGPQGEKVFVIRGGNWLTNRFVNAGGFNRNYSSYYFNPFTYVGFRCALDTGTASQVRDMADASETTRKPQVDEVAKALFTPPPCPNNDTIVLSAGGDGTSHAIAIEVPGLFRSKAGLQFPEVVLHHDAPILMHENLPFNWRVEDGGRRISCDVRRPDQGFELKSSAEVHDRRVDLSITFKNLSDKAMKRATPMCCLGASRTEYHLLDPEHERTYILTDNGIVNFAGASRGDTDRPQFRWSGVGPDKTWLKGHVVAGASVIGLTTRNRDWTYVKVFDKAETVGGNAEYSCIHSVPVLGDLAPGQEATVRGALYFLRMPPEEALPHAWQDFTALLSETEK